MKELLAYLEALSPGSLADTEQLEALLASCWHEFDGSSDKGMTGCKLRDRMEQATWDPPRIEFVIERHGGTVLGSSRAEIHSWTVDVQAKTATCGKGSHRQLRPMASGLDVHPLAEEIAQLILDRSQDARLTRSADGSVRVAIGKVIATGSAVPQTLSARRKRFRLALKERLEPRGWLEVRAYVFRPSGEVWHDFLARRGVAPIDPRAHDLLRPVASKKKARRRKRDDPRSCPHEPSRSAPHAADFGVAPLSFVAALAAASCSVLVLRCA
jgi:hypothetical protein